MGGLKKTTALNEDCMSFEFFYTLFMTDRRVLSSGKQA